MTTPAETGPAMPEPEVDARPRRRVFSAADRRRLLEEYEAAAPGQKGAMLRREGLYSSHIVDWRRQQRDAGLGAKRGRKPAKPLQVENAELKRENERLNRELTRTRRVIDVQGNVFALLQDLPRASASPSSATDSTAP